MDQINLSQPLVDRLLAVLKEHDPQCENELLASQYMAAIVGLIAAKKLPGHEDRKTFITELSAFIHHVAQDVGDGKLGQETSADNDSAFGIWTPNGE